VAVVAGAEPGPGDFFEVTLSRGRGRHGAWDCFDGLFCHIITHVYILIEILIYVFFC